jgi:sulfide:quinone oxidoreductase
VASAYDGKGICYIEFGHNRVARVEVTFRSGERPNGQFDEASDLLLAEKAEFGTSRIRRWFGREWSSY